MTLDIRAFYRTTDPSNTLNLEREQDQKYYIDFASVRGGNVIDELKRKITFFAPDEPTCQLFTGHIGCGKSTELSKLKAELTQDGFHVVFFESSDYLEMGDVDVGDILLAIAQQIITSLQQVKQLRLDEPRSFRRILQGAVDLLQTEIDVTAEGAIPGVGSVKASTQGDFAIQGGIAGAEVNFDREEGFSLVAAGIGKISAKVKESPKLRSMLREYLEPRTRSIIEAINNELIKPGIQQLKQQGKAGLVVIVDNLDRIENSTKSWGTPQLEYLFVERGEQLRQLQCHVVYTIPLALRFSNEVNRLTQRFMVDPKVLPMVPVKTRGGEQNPEGIKLLRRMILARAFSEVPSSERPNLVTQIFDHSDTLDQLCLISGGHVRELLMLLNSWIMDDPKFPLSRHKLDKVIQSSQNKLELAITNDEWKFLRQVHNTKEVRGEDAYRHFIHSMFVYEYIDTQGSWFAVNPLLARSGKLN